MAGNQKLPFSNKVIQHSKIYPHSNSPTSPIKALRPLVGVPLTTLCLGCDHLDLNTSFSLCLDYIFISIYIIYFPRMRVYLVHSYMIYKL